MIQLDSPHRRDLIRILPVGGAMAVHARRDFARWRWQANTAALLRSTHLWHDLQKCPTCRYLATDHEGLDPQQVSAVRRLHRREVLLQGLNHMRGTGAVLFVGSLAVVAFVVGTAGVVQLPWHGRARQFGSVLIALSPVYVVGLRDTVRTAFAARLLWRARPFWSLIGATWDVAFWGGIPIGALWAMRSADRRVDIWHTLDWFFPAAVLAAVLLEIASRRAGVAVARKAEAVGWTTSRSQAAALRLLTLYVSLLRSSSRSHRTSVQQLSNRINYDSHFFSAKFAGLTTPPSAARRSRQLAGSRQLGLRIAAALDQAGEQMLDTATTGQRLEITERIHALMVASLAGDFSSLPEVASDGWRSRLRQRARRSLASLGLAAFAIALPRLPGVDEHASTVTGIQVGLLLTAALTLLGAPSQTQSMVLDAYQKAEQDHGTSDGTGPA